MPELELLELELLELEDVKLEDRIRRVRALSDAIESMTITDCSKDNINEIAWLISLETRKCELLINNKGPKPV